jgi:uncharacterized repeat protein (TIGR01451 family)
MQHVSGRLVAGIITLALASLAAADSAGPVPTLKQAQVVAVDGPTIYRFTVDYTDSDGVAIASLGDNDVRVTGPNGFRVLCTFESVSPDSNGSPRTATYTFTPPGGFWDMADSGTYTITALAGGVADTLANPSDGVTLGTITVDISQPDLAVQLSAPEAIETGEPASITVHAQNNGTAVAGGVIDVDFDPAGVADRITVNPPSAGWTTPATTGLSWWLNALQPGDAATLTLDFTPTRQDTGQLNVAATASVGGDHNPADNADSLALTIQAPPPVDTSPPEPNLNLGLAAIIPPADDTGTVALDVGDTLRLSVSVTNSGDGPASDVTLAIPLSESLEYIAAQFASPTAQAGEPQTAITDALLEIELGTLAPQTDVVLELTAASIASGTTQLAVTARSSDATAVTSADVLTVTAQDNLPPPTAAPLCPAPTLTLLTATTFFLARRRSSVSTPR